MYRLIYKATTGSELGQDTDEYSIWLTEEPTQVDKEKLIAKLENKGILPDRDLDKPQHKQIEHYNQTVMVVKKGKSEIVYQRKEAKDTIFYSDGTYTIDEGTSHNYNDKYFKFVGPYTDGVKKELNV